MRGTTGLFRITFFFLVSLFSFNDSSSQKNPTKPNANLVYIDKEGVLRYTRGHKEAAFFGVNYTTPFAYSYRAHKALNVDLEKAIEQDVYHLARLGLDAFRVHVWDTEISDSLGNLLQNDHFRLFDFLLAELKNRNIRTIITPIAFWGNGYPERDERTPGFSRVFGREKLTTEDKAIQAQENYIQQFFRHVNPYTKLAYGDDADVIAVEINNEPSHNGPKSGVTDYINRLTGALKNTGWSKPVFYNISQSPFYADAVAASKVDGFSFQWYPSGLVAGQTLKGNFLPHVDQYTIPYDTIPAFANKALMVYEFDAADVLVSCMYPAMARSFRKAGFQWATQFAYDPMALAYANSEYQTHYVNLAYTPSKAISLMIASEVFHKVPRLKNYGVYPADSVFDAFHVSYKQALSEMNTEQKFYYSNTTQTEPLAKNKLRNIAGVGSSPVVHYQGSGAYFLDKVEEGVWRLEVMPDVVYIRDPFERASPKKEVTRIQWKINTMQIMLDDLNSDFDIKGLNEGNSYSTASNKDSFQILPGSYLLVRNGKKISAGNKAIGAIQLNEFFAPKPLEIEIFLRHEPFTEVSAGKPFTLQATVAGVDTGSVSLQISRLGGGQPRNIAMDRKTSSEYTVEVPADIVIPGVLNYRIIIRQANDYVVFPGNIKGNPFAWNNYSNETWKTFVAAENGDLEIFNPTTDRGARTYPSFRRNFQSGYITGEKSGQLILRLAVTELSGDHTFGFQYFFGDKLKGRNSELSSFDRVIIRARTSNPQPVKVKITLINENALSISSYIMLTDKFLDFELPFNNFTIDSSLLIPRPYPGFMPLWFKGAGVVSNFKLKGFEKIEMTIGSDMSLAEFNKPCSLEVESIRLKKSK